MVVKSLYYRSAGVFRKERKCILVRKLVYKSMKGGEK